MYKIYIKDKPFIILNQALPLASNMVKVTGNETLDHFVQLHASADVGGSYCIAPNMAAAFKSFKIKAKVIKAGGGLVQNAEGQYLFIFRKNKWDLPKGKLDKGETLAQCAVREVEEECGISNLTLGLPMVTTFHVFDNKGRWCLKETHWYHMQYKGKKAPKPQIEEDITDIKWLNNKDFWMVHENTYTMISEMVEMI